jgi:vacuolar protein sorting-associated protein 54
VDVLVDAAVRDPVELVLSPGTSPEAPPVLSAPPSAANGAPPSPAPSSPSGAPTKQNGVAVPSAGSKHVRIEDKTYYAVSATSESLVLLLDYLRIIINLSTLTIDTMGRVIEFLKAFNSRTCQVVLGAGAMRSAGLKNITARHLGTSWSVLLASTD